MKLSRGVVGVGLVLLILVCLAPETAHAQQANASDVIQRIMRESRPGEPISRPLLFAGALAAVTLAPFIITMVTSFVKISVVLSILRNALGTQQIPPNQIIIGLSIILTLFIMMPVGLKSYYAAQDIIQARTGQPLFSNATVDLATEAAKAGKEPLREFLFKHSHRQERFLFFSVARRMEENVKRDVPAAAELERFSERDFAILVPAFAISQLKEAFQIGFIIFLPFLVIDMIVANILQALGMSMLSPTTISLPFKILLFVLIDGWFLLTKGLVLGYL